MSLFIDASALVSILTQEDDFVQIAKTLQDAKGASTSPVAIFEASLAVARKTDGDVDAARWDVMALLNETGCTVEELVSADGDEALRAHQRFGKGRHPAALNMGDCFSYACAKRLGVPLLFKGDDFALTDIPSAMDF
jgi:ribonuclease VapC